MSVSIGGLCIMPLRNYLLALLFGKVAFRSMFLAVLSFLFLLILAYLTNPSETSFRTYLTEQSFRQHLSRLDETNEDDHHHVDQTPRHPASGRCGNSNDGVTPFHFANRASISLRTPKHVFNSLGVFTIAAIVPLSNPNNNTSSARNIYRDGSMITDSWFIGAFGKWWRGGIIEAWYHNLVARSKDEESWNSGILAMKTLDKLNDYHNGLPFTTKNTLPSAATRNSPPRLRNRERPSQTLGALQARSSTPPPLPKSASLPLHATRFPNSVPDTRHAQVDKIVSQTTSPLPTSEHTRVDSAVLPSCSSSTLFDQSPVIVEVLRQISASNSAVRSLRDQLAESKSTAAQSHALLQTEVDSYRDRKRTEDASRLELKSRTKTLEDSKRNAESTKLKAERKLKTAQNACSEATRRIDFLDQQISELQQGLMDGRALALQSKDNASKMEQKLLADLEVKKQEMKTVEDEVTALNARAKELEDRLASEKEKLQLARERANIRRLEQSFSIPSPVSVNHLDAPFLDHADLFVSTTDQHLNGAAVLSNREHSISPGFSKLPVVGLSNFNSSPPDTNQLALRAKGYSIFDDDIASLNQPPHQITKAFSPFDDNNSLDHVSAAGTFPMPHSSSSLVQSGLLGSHNGMDSFKRGFHLDNDPFSDQDRRGMILLPQPSGDNTSPTTTSPVSIHDPSTEYDRFEVRPLLSSSSLPLPPAQPSTAPPSQPLDLQRFTIAHRTQSDPPNSSDFDSSATSSLDLIDTSKVVGAAQPRRWFSTRERPKKGLNPDAKVFNLPRKAMSIAINNVGTGVSPHINVSAHGIGNGNASPVPMVFDALNPNGVSSSNVTSSASTAFLHAFAPSPAEREALKRALGGGSNASLELLPSLSDVGNISLSSSPPPREPALLQTPPSLPGISTGSSVEQEIASGRGLPSWLQTLPRIRKPKFCPWDDDEVVVDPASGGGTVASPSRKR